MYAKRVIPAVAALLMGCGCSAIPDGAAIGGTVHAFGVSVTVKATVPPLPPTSQPVPK